MIAGWTVLPSEYFSPVYSFGGYRITQNTYSIHRGSGSWVSPELRIKKSVIRRIAPVVGKRPAEIIGRIIGELKCNGLRKGLHNLKSVSTDVVNRRKAEAIHANENSGMQSNSNSSSGQEKDHS